MLLCKLPSVPSSARYRPGGQSVQKAAPGESENVPAAQGVHAVCIPSGLNVPAGQVAQSEILVRPSVAVLSPAGHERHCAALVAPGLGP
jgi:hypothetical protein